MDAADNLMTLLVKTKRELKDCVNELCLRCGDYKEEHLGRCDGCRWKEVRHPDTRRNPQERQAVPDTARDCACARM